MTEPHEYDAMWPWDEDRYEEGAPFRRQWHLEQIKDGLETIINHCEAEELQDDFLGVEIETQLGLALTFVKQKLAEMEKEQCTKQSR